MDIEWQFYFNILYYISVIIFTVQIIYTTPSPSKASAYILLIILLPIIGVIIYLSFGLNYRKSSLYDKKLQMDNDQKEIINQFKDNYLNNTTPTFKSEHQTFSGLGKMLYTDTESFVTHNNKLKLLLNGENKFPEIIEALKNAKSQIHLEYYIYNNDSIGREIAEILMQKAREGVEVRFIFDDFGSRSIRKKLVPELQKSGVEAYAFYKIKFVYLANRLNYRNHRKIAIIDGEVAFVGGINVGDKYINIRGSKGYWRDTHLKIEGEAIMELQRIFIADWNFCSRQSVKPSERFFKKMPELEDGQWTQIVNSGPDSQNPSILYSFLYAITTAKKEILITTPYLIPNNEFLYALHMAVLRGVQVKILVPKKSDSWIVDAVSKSYFNNLLKRGIDIYQYEKGMVHAKTMVFDEEVCIIGTANLDNRSFDLNFEVNAIVYDNKISLELKQAFLEDLSFSSKIDSEKWLNRNVLTTFVERALRLVSPLM